MWKWVIRDYFAAYRWEKVKVWLKRGSGWGVFYFGIFIPTMLCNTAEAPMWRCLLLSWSMLFGLVSNGLHPEALSKIMFLCPMNREKRKQYIAHSYLFRILMTTGMGALAIGVLLALRMVSPLMALLYVWNVWILSVILCGMCNAKVFNPSEKEQALAYKVDGTIATVNLILAGLVTYLIIVIVLCWKKENMFWWEVIFGGIAVLIQLPLIIQILKKWKENIRKAATFERMD